MWNVSYFVMIINIFHSEKEELIHSPTGETNIPEPITIPRIIEQPCSSPIRRFSLVPPSVEPSAGCSVGVPDLPFPGLPLPNWPFGCSSRGTTEGFAVTSSSFVTRGCCTSGASSIQYLLTKINLNLTFVWWDSRERLVAWITELKQIRNRIYCIHYE